MKKVIIRRQDVDEIIEYAKEYSLDLKEQLQAIKDMRAKGQVLIGNWHFHPCSPLKLAEEIKDWPLILESVI